MSSSALKRDEAAAVTAVLQNASESVAARTAACDAVLELSKSEGSCAVLCSVGGIHAVVSALRGPERSPAMLKAALTTLSNLYRFDPKLVSIIARLQRGIVSILEAMREHLHSEDSSLLHALLGALSDVSNAPANAVLIAQENGTAVLLACVLAHLKDELTLLPALHVLGAISRTPSHVSLLVREGGVPALLAAILAHLKRVEMLKAALGVLRNIVSDTQAAQRLSGQGAYRIIFAVLQTHCQPAQLDLVRLGSAVLWKMHHCRYPPDALLHAQLAFHPGGVEQLDADDGPNSSGASDDDEPVPRNGKGGKEGPSSSAFPIPVSHSFKMGGHAEFIDAPPTELEPCEGGGQPLNHAELVVRAIVGEAERLLNAGPNLLPVVVVPAAQAELERLDGATWPREHSQPVAAAPPPRMRLSAPSVPRWVCHGRPCECVTSPTLPGSAGPASPATKSLDASRAEAHTPRVVYEALPVEGCEAEASLPTNSLAFDSSFESANLRRAVQVRVATFPPRASPLSRASPHSRASPLSSARAAPTRTTLDLSRRSGRARTTLCSTATRTHAATRSGSYSV